MGKAASAERQAKTQIDGLAAEVGQRIRAARLERGMSLAQVGGNDLTRSFLSLVELGRSRISLRALAIVAERLELPISYFLDSTSGMSDSLTELELDQAEGALARQEPEESLRILDEVHASEWLRPRLLWLRGRALIDAGRAREAIGVLEEGLSLIERRGGSPLLPQLCYTLGMALYSAGNYDEGLIYLRRAIDEAAHGPEDPLLVGKATVCIGHVLYVRGDIEGAIEHYSRARDLFGSLTDLNALGCVYSGLSLAYKRKGDLTSALRYSKLSVAAFEAKQNARLAAGELNNLALRYEELDNLEKALECGNESVLRAQQIHAQDVEAAAHSTLASIYLKLHDVEDAEKEAVAADSLAEGSTARARVDAWIVLAEIAERRSDHARADELYRKALEVLKQVGHETAYADAALGYSLLLQERGETEQALDFALEAAQLKAARPMEARRA